MNKTILANKPFLFILLTVFLAVLGIGVIIPVLPFIVGQYVDASQPDKIAFYIGWLTSLYAICQFFAAPVLGALSDKYGRRPILLLCLLGSAVGYILFGIGGSLTILFVARIIDGITGGDMSTAMAYIADVTKPQERGQYFGIIGATAGLGFIVGPSLGGLVAQISHSAPLYLAAILTIISVIYGYFALPESLEKKNRTADFSWHHLNPFTQLQYVLKNSLIRLLIIIGFFYYLTLAELSGISSVFLKDTFNWNPTQIGMIFLILGIGDMVTQGYLSGKLLPKFGVIKVTTSGFIIAGVAFLISAFLVSHPIPSLAYVYILIYALGSGLFEPAFNGLISGVADPSEQGRVQGASQSAQSINRIIGPLLGAWLYQIGHAWPWLSCVLFVIIGTIILLLNRSQITQHLHAQEA